MELTSQERVNRMFARQDHDRVPRFDSYWSETITRWQNEGLKGDGGKVLEILGADLHGIGGTWPAPYPGRNEVVREDADTKDIRDAHGKIVRYWKNKSGTPEHLGFECDTREKWETIFKPALLDTGLQLDPSATVRNYRQGRAKGKWCFIDGVEAFEQTRALLGDVIAMMAFAEDPDWIRDISRTYADVQIRNWDAIMTTGIQPDGVWAYGDMAFKTATMCSPAMYKELVWPDHKRLADWAHAHNMKFIYHTDGDVNAVLDLYLAAGFDCLQPLESKAGMDIRKLGPKYGDRLAFFGNIDVMVMGTNDKAKLEHEISTKFAAGMAKNAYMYHSDHSVPPTTSWETYQFIIQMIEKYGLYQ